MRGSQCADLNDAQAIITGSVGLVAQLVEQRIENPRVGGSIPPQATNKSSTACLCLRTAGRFALCRLSAIATPNLCD